MKITSINSSIQVSNLLKPLEVSNLKSEFYEKTKIHNFNCSFFFSQLCVVDHHKYEIIMK